MKEREKYLCELKSEKEKELECIRKYFTNYPERNVEYEGKGRNPMSL